MRLSELLRLRDLAARVLGADRTVPEAMHRSIEQSLRVEGYVADRGAIERDAAQPPTRT